MKTHVFHPRFFLAGVVILFLIATLLAFAFLIGVITSSTAVSIMATYGVFFFGVMLAGHARIEAALSKEWQALLIKALYWIMPKTAELATAVFLLATGLVSLSTRAFPGWLAWASVVMAAWLLIPPIAWPALLFGFPLWLVVVSVVLWARPRSGSRPDPAHRTP